MILTMMLGGTVAVGIASPLDEGDINSQITIEPYADFVFPDTLNWTIDYNNPDSLDSTSVHILYTMNTDVLIGVESRGFQDINGNHYSTLNPAVKYTLNNHTNHSFIAGSPANSYYYPNNDDLANFASDPYNPEPYKSSLTLMAEMRSSVVPWYEIQAGNYQDVVTFTIEAAN